MAVTPIFNREELEGNEDFIRQDSQDKQDYGKSQNFSFIL
jgi:hypothetical protein